MYVPSYQHTCQTNAHAAMWYHMPFAIACTYPAATKKVLLIYVYTITMYVQLHVHTGVIDEFKDLLTT